MKWAAIAIMWAVALPVRAAYPGYSVCPGVDHAPLDYASVVAHDPALQKHLADIEAGENRAITNFGARQIFADLLASLGEAIVFDRSLSVNGNQACAFCHTASAGFRGAVAVFNQAGGVFPGSVASRTGFRVPQSLAYAAFSPPLAWHDDISDFRGGNFWDGRATGLTHTSPAVEQAMEPFTNPFEMGLPDSACAVRRVIRGRYGAMFAQVWGQGAAAIAWPAKADAMCAVAAGGTNTVKLALAPADRAIADTAFQQIASTIVAFEISTHASAFSSKFDAWQAGLAKFNTDEQRGWVVFNGAGGCAACHSASGARPLFTNFSYAHLALPAAKPAAYVSENRPDAAGYVANSAGAGFVDRGFAGVLAASPNTNWRQRAPAYEAAFVTPSLRNVASLPAQGLPAAYTHNGSIATLAAAVHFFNALGIPPDAAQRAHVPAGPIHLTAADEHALVAFLGTLTDGYYRTGALTPAVTR